MSLAAEKAAADALSKASDALISAAFELMAHQDWHAAKAANEASREANEQCKALLDNILSRWWVRAIIWVAVKLGKAPAQPSETKGD